jgi:hypothetical protein
VTALLAGCGGGHHGAQLDPVSGQASTSLTTSPSTTVSLAPGRQAVVDAANRFYALTGQCAANPASPCDLSAVAGPPESAAFAQKMAALATHGLKVRPMPASHLVIDSVTIANPPTQATVAVCQVDADVVYTPGAGPNGQDVIYNNAVDSYQNTWVFQLNPAGGSQWKLYSDTRTGQSTGATCAPAG